MKPTLFALLSCFVITCASPIHSEPPALPAEWIKAWANPPTADRPLQIVHGIGHTKSPDASKQGADADALAAELNRYKDLHLGGVVCNVAFQDYLQSEKNWKVLARAVDGLADLGMTAWIYDEEGYPSGAAGGLVLKENRQFEASELAFDPSKPDPFVVRPAYEFTHASNNFAGARRYINLIDDRAVHCFINKTHDAYFRWLGPRFGTTVAATFTDEPSLITVDLGPLKARIIDPIDPSVRPLPAVPWCYDLAEQFQQRYHRDLMPLRRSLFVGNSPEDRQARCQFWSLIADLVADRYFGAIQTWCAAHRVASSGHTLWEEAPLHHVPLEGNALKSLGRMDIPGLDLLSSDPEVAGNANGWLTAGLPASAAILNGRRRVMTEVSDFSQSFGGQGPAGLPEMQATAAWQAACGVTDFTLYYSPDKRSADSYRTYCDYVGRINAILKTADRTPKTLLYYPIYDLWAEYRPTAERLQLESQSPRAQQIVHSFIALGRLLQQSQVPFVLIDHEGLERATIEADGSIKINDRTFASIVLPDGVELPQKVADLLDRMRQNKGRVLAGTWDAAKMSSASLIESLQPAERITPASPMITLGRFTRDGRNITLLVNTGRQPYEGMFATRTTTEGRLLDPADGQMRPAETASPGQIRLKLAPRQAIVLVQ